MIVRRLYFGIFGNTTVWRGLTIRGYKTSDNFFDNSNDDENKLLARIEHQETIESSKNVSESVKKHQKQEKLVRVAIVGVPNAGKSTLINALAEHRVSIWNFWNSYHCLNIYSFKDLSSVSQSPYNQKLFEGDYYQGQHPNCIF